MNRGDRVRVLEPGIQAWTGIVKAIKHSVKSGWWYELERDDTNHDCWIIHESYVRPA